MSDINRVIIVGRLTADPELRSTAGGTSVASFSVAVNSREKHEGEWQDRADFFDVTVWEGQAEACAQYLSRGQRVGLEGRLRQEQWEKDGQKRSKVKIVATSVQFLEKPAGGEPPQHNQFVPSAAEEEIPF